MERILQHKFIDLAAPTAEEAAQQEPKAMSRRQFLSTATAMAAITSMSAESFAQNFDRYSDGAAPVRYPEPDVIGLDKRFKYKLGNTPIVRLHRGTMWAEGPAWNGAGR